MKISFPLLKNALLLTILFVVLATNTLSAQKTADYLAQVGQKDSVFSEILNEYRTIYIQLPDSYHETSDNTYPVVYIIDGELHLPTLSVIYRNYEGGFLPEMILVGIDNSHDRIRDLTPSKVSSLYGSPYEGKSGGANRFAQFLDKDLIPHIEQKFKASPYRTLIGHSYGGLFTLNTLIHHNKLFQNYLAIDPSLDWDNDFLVKEAKASISEGSLKGKSLFMSLNGQIDMQNPNATMDDIMNSDSPMTGFARANGNFSLLLQQSETGLEYAWKMYPNDIHGTIALPSIMDGLLSLFSWFQMENTHQFNNFETPAERLREIMENRKTKLDARFGYNVPPYPEDLLAISGLMYIDMGQFDKSKMFLDFALESYPNSVMVNEALTDYFVAVKNREQALDYASKTYEISQSEQHKLKLEELESRKKRWWKK